MTLRAHGANVKTLDAALSARETVPEPYLATLLLTFAVAAWRGWGA